MEQNVITELYLGRIFRNLQIGLFDGRKDETYWQNLFEEVKRGTFWKKIRAMNTLFIEIDRDTTNPVAPERQEMGLALSTTLRPVTEKEYTSYQSYYRLHNKCKHHLVVDIPQGDYCQRSCAICNTFIGLI